MNAGRFSYTVRNPDGGFLQYAEDGLGLDAPDAMSLEQLFNPRPA